MHVRSKRLPSKSQTQEQQINQLRNDILALHTIMSHHFKNLHKMTDLEIKNYIESIFQPKQINETINKENTENK